MTTEVELLPLHYDELPEIPEDIVVRMQAYARANVLHHTALLRAEIEALRAEQEVIVAEAKKYAGESGRLKAKVELLAEALRLAEEHIDFITPKWYSAGQRVLAAIRAALGKENSND